MNKPMTRMSLLSLSALAILLSGCRGGSLALNYHDHGPRERVVVHDRHVCGKHCHDHYWDGRRIVVIGDRHRHGPGCGHYWDGRHWVVVDRGSPRRPIVHDRPPVVQREHVHGPNCGCAFHRRTNRWVVIDRGHRHGPGCGHVFVDGRWIID